MIERILIGIDEGRVLDVATQDGYFVRILNIIGKRNSINFGEKKWK